VEKTTIERERRRRWRRRRSEVDSGPLVHVGSRLELYLVVSDPGGPSFHPTTPNVLVAATYLFQLENAIQKLQV
jgi:hypothetical protein